MLHQVQNPGRLSRMILANLRQIFYRRFSLYVFDFQVISSLSHISSYIVAFQTVSARFKLRLRISSYFVAFILFNSYRRFSTSFVACFSYYSDASDIIEFIRLFLYRRSYCCKILSSQFKMHRRFKKPCRRFSTTCRFSKCIVDVIATMDASY